MFRVLAVDDDPEVLEMYRCLLCRQGVAVDTVSVPSEVLKILYETCQRHYDLVLTDLEMPGLGGEALARVVRCNRRIPVVMITATPREEDTHTSATLYLQKPLTGRSIDNLMELIHTMMEKKEADPDRPMCTEGQCLIKGIGVVARSYTS